MTKFSRKTYFRRENVVYLDKSSRLRPAQAAADRSAAAARRAPSCTGCGRLGQTQRVYYQWNGCSMPAWSQEAERRVRGIHEGIYQATGRSYWLSPRVGRIGLRSDRLSLGYLLDLMEDVQADVAALDPRRPASIGVSGDIQVRPSAGVLDELQRAAGPVHPLRRCRGGRVRAWPSPAIRKRPDDRTQPDRACRGLARQTCTSADRPAALCVAGRARRRAVARQGTSSGAATRRTAPSRTSACCTWTSAPSGSPGPWTGSRPGAVPGGEDGTLVTLGRATCRASKTSWPTRPVPVERCRRSGPWRSRTLRTICPVVS